MPETLSTPAFKISRLHKLTNDEATLTIRIERSGSEESQPAVAAKLEIERLKRPEDEKEYPPFAVMIDPDSVQRIKNAVSWIKSRNPLLGKRPLQSSDDIIQISWEDQPRLVLLHEIEAFAHGVEPKQAFTIGDGAERYYKFPSIEELETFVATLEKKVQRSR